MKVATPECVARTKFSSAVAASSETMRTTTENDWQLQRSRDGATGRFDKEQAMKHYTCDLCGRPISDERYTARIEIVAAFDPECVVAPSEDSDHLDQIADEIEALEDTAQFNLPESGPKTFTFDLCPPCQRRVVRDPLNRAARKQLNFSPN